MRHTTRTNEALINHPTHISTNLKQQETFHRMNKIYEIVFNYIVNMFDHALRGGCGNFTRDGFQKAFNLTTVHGVRLIILYCFLGRDVSRHILQLHVMDVKK